MTAPSTADQIIRGGRWRSLAGITSKLPPPRQASPADNPPSGSSFSTCVCFVTSSIPKHSSDCGPGKPRGPYRDSLLPAALSWLHYRAGCFEPIPWTTAETIVAVRIAFLNDATARVPDDAADPSVRMAGSAREWIFRIRDDGASRVAHDDAVLLRHPRQHPRTNAPS